MNPPLTVNVQPNCIWPVGAKLGEGVIWHAESAQVYFVDIKGQQIHRCAADGSARQSWSAPQQIGFFLPHKDGGFICGLQDGLYHFSESTGEFVLIRHVEHELPGNRLNDGYADAPGNLWFGSMDDNETDSSGRLYCLNQAGTLAVMDSDYVITNGPAMSPDGKILYHTDTLKKQVYAFDVHVDGSLVNKRLFVAIQGTGHPDGMAVDAQGNVWIALFGGSRIECYSASGQLKGSVAFPCPNITKLTFGGADCRTVFVTTAWKQMQPDQRAAHPLAGGLFSFRTESPGLPQNKLSIGGVA